MLLCREQHLPELLDVAYGLLRLRYLAHAWQALQQAPSWQAAEAALYLLTAVSLAVKARVLAEGGARGGGGDENSGSASESPAVAQDRQQTAALLTALFGRVCSDEGAASMLGAHPLLAAAACRLVGQYAAWFGRARDEAPVQGGLRLLLRALPIAEVSVQTLSGCR
jgi:hypothetical protein